MTTTRESVHNALDSAIARKLHKEGPKLMTDMSAFKTMDSQGTFASTPDVAESDEEDEPVAEGQDQFLGRDKKTWGEYHKSAHFSKSEAKMLAGQHGGTAEDDGDNLWIVKK